MYHSNSYWFVFKTTGKSPSIWVCLPHITIKMDMFLEHWRPSKWVCFRILDTHIWAYISQVNPPGAEQSRATNRKNSQKNRFIACRYLLWNCVL